MGLSTEAGSFPSRWGGRTGFHPSRWVLGVALVALAGASTWVASAQSARPGNPILGSSAPSNTCPDPRASNRPPFFDQPMVNPVVYDAARQQVYTLDSENHRLDIIDAQTGTFRNSIPV